MRAREFIFEGYREVQQKYIAAGADEHVVKTAIQQFKDLVNRNQVKGDERNIDWWGKNKTFEKFSEFLQQKGIDTSKTQIKRSKIEGRSVTLLDNDNWFIVVPLDKNASCFHGKNTNWCTTKRDQEQFEKYFYKQNVVLIYCINKQTGGKWAIADYQNAETDYSDEDEDEHTAFLKYERIRKNGWAELFDRNDNSITRAQFQSQTGLDSEEIQGMAIEASDEIWQHLDSRLGKQEEYRKKLSTITDRDITVERDIMDVGDIDDAYNYVMRLGNTGIDVGKMPIKLQLLASQKSDKPSIIKWISEPDFKVAQMSSNHQNDALGQLLDRDNVDTRLLTAISPNKFTTQIIKQLIDRQLLTPELQRHIASSKNAIKNLNKAGIKPSAEDVEHSFSKNLPTHIDGVVTLFGQYLNDYGVAPSASMMSQAAENAGTTADDIKARIFTRMETTLKNLNIWLDNASKKIEGIRSEIARSELVISQLQDRHEQLKNKPDLTDQERMVFLRIPGSISYNQEVIGNAHEQIKSENNDAKNYIEQIKILQNSIKLLST